MHREQRAEMNLLQVMPPPREFRDPIPPPSTLPPTVQQPAKLADPCFNTHKRQTRSSVTSVTSMTSVTGEGSGGGGERIERAREIQRGLEKRMERRKSQYEDVVASHNQVRSAFLFCVTSDGFQIT